MVPQSNGPASWWRGAVLFDVDGTLVDSAYLHTVAWWHAFRQHQHEVPMAAIHWCVGMGGDRLVDRLLPADRDREADAEIMASHAAVFATNWPSLTAFDGAKDLLAQCHAGGLAVALASSARREDLAANRAALAADAYIHAATSSNDAEESKPAPDILAAALEAVGGATANAVYVGDAVWDMKAAAALGVPSIGVTCGGRSAAELFDAGAAEVYAGPRDLLDNLQASAIGRLLALPS
ncbi:HAD family hydrolase [Pseudarthrobacter sulfonivorans]|uniref:HAD family hydrolase n=1 Tax=Pseudarthrobacter sulfonivorans TaxID=121292 RepID=UPI002103B803|nr:HAD family hydrolase [Pseudarthrobacter sulfonivorans]